MLKDAELMTQAEIDRAASQLFGRQRGGDFNFAQLKVALDIDVG
jgi:hypothetical protein